MFPQSFGDHIHGPALRMPDAVVPPVHDGQRAGEKFGGNPHKRADPHPEYGTGAADRNGNSHTGDVPHTDGCGQGTDQGLKMGDVTGLVGIIEFAANDIDSMFEIAEGDKTGVQQQEKTAANEQVQQIFPGCVCKSNDDLFDLPHNRFLCVF